MVVINDFYQTNIINFNLKKNVVAKIIFKSNETEIEKSFHFKTWVVRTK